MREDILNWRHKSGEKVWMRFLDLFEKGPVSDEEFKHIVKNSSENFANHEGSHYNPVRKCLNAIHNKDKFTERDLTAIDNDFLNGKDLNGKKISLKIFLDRIEKYPMSEETFERLLDSPNTTTQYNKNAQHEINPSKRIRKIANKLHRQNKYIPNEINSSKGIREIVNKSHEQNKHTQAVSYAPAEEISQALESQVIQSKPDAPEARRNRLEQAPEMPEQIQVFSLGFRRSADIILRLVNTMRFLVSLGFGKNADVIAEVLVRANGVCEKCDKPAPFKRKKDNTAYLEVHHKVMLSRGGEDTVENAMAVCPNCHRELHFGV